MDLNLLEKSTKELKENRKQKNLVKKILTKQINNLLKTIDYGNDAIEVEDDLNDVLYALPNTKDSKELDNLVNKTINAYKMAFLSGHEGAFRLNLEIPENELDEYFGNFEKINNAVKSVLIDEYGFGHSIVVLRTSMGTSTGAWAIEDVVADKNNKYFKYFDQL